MPIHDWTRVNAGTFHDFHNSWIIHLKETLNGGLLPDGFYALSEQHAGAVIADVLTLDVGAPNASKSEKKGPVAVAEKPPRASRKVVASQRAAYRAMRKTLAIRHVSNHRLVAMIEILSPANKDRAASVDEFVQKAHAALRQGCHLLVIDLFPPGPHDPRGLHPAIWDWFDADEEPLAADKPLLLASYVAGKLPVAYLEPVAVGDVLPDMALFLEPKWWIDVPLEKTYQEAYRGMPSYWRDVLEGREQPASD